MTKKILFLSIALVASMYLFAQKQEKIYYDKDWKGCSQSKAEFYRVVNYDANGKPVGKVMDYFITGELQSEIDGATYIDKNDDTKSVFIGFSRGFFKSGAKEFERFNDNQGKTITHKIWYENGNLSADGTFKNEQPVTVKKWYRNGNLMSDEKFENGKYEGNATYYYESGKLYRKFIFTDGKLADKFFLECDEFGKCQNVFYENFYSSDNVNQWIIGNNKDLSSEILPEKGLLMKFKTDHNGFRNSINIPLNLTENFSIETVVDFKNGETNNGHGIIWGFKDWDNYSFFGISANGYYVIMTQTEGVSLTIKEWTKSDIINQNKQRNMLKLLRIDDKIYFSINQQLVYSDNFYGFRGNNIGFYTLGKKEVLYENLIVKQDFSNSENSNASKTNSNSDWRGNGSGFFIDYRGYIATNYHVIKDATQIEINFIRDGQQQAFNAEVIQSDRQNDLAILKISDSSFKPFTNVPYNFQTTLSDVGTNIFALGYPMANIMGSEIKFTDGKISSRTGVQGDITMYQISVPIQSGNSGGALFDYDGNLVGVTSAGLNRDYFNSENVNYAIKSSYLKNLIEVLPVSVRLPNDKTIATKTLTEKIKILSDYVVLIKIK
ncbi:MAG: trypsin-like peptidase domain-containing protein [Marinilabiliaceae bacterium]|nr:trypsin-like peptidase domain-containing protein [Marinilabiliaceae bacterium]